MDWRRGQPPRRRRVVTPEDSIVERIADLYCKLLCALMAKALHGFMNAVHYDAVMHAVSATDEMPTRRNVRYFLNAPPPM
jgi:hypothetical protein